IPGETSALFTPEPVNASYFVQTTAPNGCSAISEPFHYNVDGFEQINSTSLNFYPNPANELIFIQNSGISTSFQLCDITGRILKTSSITTNSIISVSLGDLTPGIYWLKTPSNTQRLVIF
ncbi:MAG TPA: T9SS type A sorting domain-containing protein, partial [Flavobacteriales bacterium]|nr:T9SS type A sorting domain-containing protein [Flavobacteriales bacterium]